jgi:catechol 1,2-dioxygenase
VTTHLFVAGDEYLGSDAAFAVKPELIVTPARVTDRSVAASYEIDTPFLLFECPVRLVPRSTVAS